MKASNDSNSLLIRDAVARAFFGILHRRGPLLAREIELLEMVLGSCRDVDPSHVSTLGLLEPGSSSAHEKSATAGWQVTEIV